MINFELFCDEVENMMAGVLCDYDVESIRLEKVTHNNNTEHMGIVILLKGEKLAPTIYLEGYYNEYLEGKSISDICCDVADRYRRAREKMKHEKIEIDLADLKEHVFLRLVNSEKNQDMLVNVPHVIFYDMAITFRYLVKLDESGIASVLIDNDNLKESGMTVEELYGAAKENTIKLFPPFLMRLDNFLNSRYPQNEKYPKEPEIYILSNQQFIYGATMMLYKDILMDFCDSIHKDVYLIPSSVNEVLLCFADCGGDKDILQKTLREVNGSVVSDMDFLSDTLYYYDKEKDEIRIA